MGQTTRVGFSATLSRRGSSQCWLHSQWESRNVKTLDVAASAPLTRDRIKPSRLELRISRTLRILANSSPSNAAVHREREKEIILYIAKRYIGERVKVFSCVVGNCGTYDYRWNRRRGWFRGWDPPDCDWARCKKQTRINGGKMVAVWQCVERGSESERVIVKGN